MTGLGEFTLAIVYELLASAILEGVNYTALQFFQRRRIERRVEDATAEVVEPLLPFLAQERISEDKQRLLIQTCVDELRPLTKRPELLFQGSLNGQMIFEDLYADRDLPEAVVEEGLKDLYTLLCPRIATLLCKIPAAVKDWESEAWSESFRRLDEISTQMRAVFSKVDELATSPTRETDALLAIVRRSLAQRIRLELDLTGLRSDQPLSGRFDDFFVHPEIIETAKEEEKDPRTASTSEESLSCFTRRGHQGVVIGPPGAGKSTWSKWLQREALSANWTGIGVRVELRRVSNGSLPSLHGLLREAAGTHMAEELTPSRIGRWLRDKQIVFILDGFDEIRPAERDKAFNWIVELCTAARGCPFVLTSRPLTTDHLERFGRDWSHWAIEPFDEERIVDYIQRWYTHMPLLSEGERKIDAAAIAAEWRADATILPLTGNPLLLSTLLMVHHLDGRLPTGRSQLYRRYVEGMLGLWDDRRKVAAESVPLSLEQKRQILRGFALGLFLQGQDQVDESTAAQSMQEVLDKMRLDLCPRAVLDTLSERSGLIVGPGVYSFVHKSVAEYLVAETVLQGDQRDESGRRIDRFYLFGHRDDDQWNTVTFLWSGLAPLTDVEAFIDECLESGVWRLAYGILFDQYERMPPETRRRLLLEAFANKHALTLPAEPSVFWLTSSGHSSDELAFYRLLIPDTTLRGIGRGSLTDLLMSAAEDGTITWSDGVNMEGDVRDLLWMCSATKPRNIEDWKACLTASCPGIATPEDWLYWVAEAVFMGAGHGRTVVDLETLADVYREACPGARGLVPIALMSVLCIMGGSYHEKTSYDSIPSFLRVLSNSDYGNTPAQLLRSTSQWHLRVSPSKSIDLLTVFIENMQKLSEEGILERDATYERAIRWVRELRKRREALAS